MSTTERRSPLATRAMIPAETIATINSVRDAFLNALGVLADVPSLRTLLQTSKELAAEYARIAAAAERRHLRQACTGEVTCAIVGSSGHGKTTILDEMFPALAERGWLETDVTDTTSQALRVAYAAPDDPRAGEVTVTSWSIAQIKQLMNHPQVRDQNEQDRIEVTYLEDAVIVDGSDTTLDPRDLAEWRYPRRVELRPFTAPFVVNSEQARDRKFIRALTVKEQSAVLTTGPVLEHGGRRYDALQLRALVESVGLRDGFDRVLRWADGEGEAEQLRKLTFVDTPGLAVSSVAKDEVLRHFLGKKSNQIALELLKNDELDVVVHLVLCGQKSQFAALWQEIERECGRAEMEGIAERLILAVNGMNIYFTNPDIRAKYTDPETTAREGDHFAATLEDNVLQRMSPRGQIRPARIVFLDSKNIVDAFGDYAEFYRRHRKTMEAWAEPGGVGHDTLARLGCAQSFRDNIDALADPEDRGQGYLVRQLLELIGEKGEAILVRKHLARTGLLRAIDALHALLGRFYDGSGRLDTAAANEAMAQCLSFLDRRDLGSIERFAREQVDPFLEGLLPSDDDDRDPRGGDAGGWLEESFRRMCEMVKEAILEAQQRDGEGAAKNGSRIPAAIWTEFGRHFDERTQAWGARWGYADSDLPHPREGAVGTKDLVVHCLRLHAREILFQLLTSEAALDARGFAQSDADRDAIGSVLRALEEAKAAGANACTRHGVNP